MTHDPTDENGPDSRQDEAPEGDGVPEGDEVPEGDGGPDRGESADLEDLSPEKQERIQAHVDEYESVLRERYRRADDRSIIESHKDSLFERLVELERGEKQLDPEELREEEHQVISSNLILSLTIVVLFVAASLTVGEDFERIATMVSDFFIRNFSWYYILVSSGSLMFLIYLALSRFGPVVLGDPDEKPEFSDMSWYSMLFSAGVGVGLMFYGVSEPVHHFIHPAMGEPRTSEAARWAMVYSAFHWGLHVWGFFGLCAVGAAYYGFRRRKKYLVSSAIIEITSVPILRKGLKVFSDLIATLAVVFGVAGSLGLGVLNVAGGLEYSFGIDASSTTGYCMILGLMTLCFIASATTGLKVGIKYLSNFNVFIAFLLLGFVFFNGPTLFCLKIFVDTLGKYLNEIFQLSFQIAPFTPEYEKWMGDWTLLYFTWVSAWSPFVGVFIARISRGRTLRQVIFGTLVIPTVVTIFWFSVFGGSALYLEVFTDNGISALVDKDITVAFFALLEQYPLKQWTSGLAILLIFTFLVTSADSATFTVAMMTTEGDLDPSLGMKLLWGTVLATVTLVLVVSGGLKAVQAVAMTFAFPFSLVLILIAVSVYVRLSIQVEADRI